MTSRVFIQDTATDEYRERVQQVRDQADVETDPDQKKRLTQRADLLEDASIIYHLYHCRCGSDHTTECLDHQREIEERCSPSYRN